MFARRRRVRVATVVFGLSRNFYLSLAALFVLGASDMISSSCPRAGSTFATPTRCAAASARQHAVHRRLNELAIRIRIDGAIFGTVPAVVIGGLGTLAVVRFG